MKIVVTWCLIAAGFVSTASAETRIEEWKFIKRDVSLDVETAGWETVHVPHTWNAGDGHDGGTYYRGPAWYQTDLKVDGLRDGQRVFLRFDAVGTAAEVFIDQKIVGSHLGGYTAFAFEITDYVKDGASHDLRVKADNTWRPDVAPLSGDFTVCGGLHRPVELIVKNGACISPLDHASPGVFIYQDKVEKNKAELRVKTLIDNGLDVSKTIRVETVLLDADGNSVARSQASAQVGAKDAHTLEKTIKVRSPHLWQGVEDPYLYTLKVALFDGENLIDQYEQRVGLRSFHINPEKGFFLNGKPYPLRGVNIHQDRAVKGAAVSDSDIRKDFELIRDIGANALRLAHYPHVDLSYELCDEIGLLAWAEIPLVNQITHDPGFAPNARQQLLEMVRQHGNHCSIFTWSLCNEMFHAKTDDPLPLLNELNVLCKEEDPTRPTTLATNYQREDLCRIPDIFAFNKYPGWYNSNPDGMAGQITTYNKIGGGRGVGVSEYGAGGSIQHQDLSLKRVEPGGKWHPEQWQAYLHEKQYAAIVADPACWGSFVWAMFDFSSDGRDEGDRPGVNDKGLVTHDRSVRKDVFYFYKAQWSKEPVLHLTSKRCHVRNSPETPIKVYTNLKDVRLAVNGKRIDGSDTDEFGNAIWEGVTLKEGENRIVVEARDEKGQPVQDEVVWIYDPAAPVPGPAAEMTIVHGLVSASAAEVGNPPQNAFDGNPETRWATKIKGAWIAQEFEKPVTAGGISIAWYKGGERSYSFEVQTSTDGNTWRSAYKGKSLKQDGMETYRFDRSYEMVHLRIICNGSEESPWTSIIDVRLHDDSLGEDRPSSDPLSN